MVHHATLKFPKLSMYGDVACSYGNEHRVCAVQVGPNTTVSVASALRSLHINVLSQHPRPVLLFFGNDVPEAQYSETTVASFTPPEILELVEVNTKPCAHDHPTLCIKPVDRE